jgi:hypothetical protein
MTRRDHEKPGTQGAGPFPGPASLDIREAAETDRGPFERRRGGDRRAQDQRGNGDDRDHQVSQRARPWGRRRSDLMVTGPATGRGRARLMARRFREPLIGLALAGVAVPLINASLGAPEEEAESEDEARGDVAVASGDLDEAVGEYWAEAEDTLVRERTIEGAATRWGISDLLAGKIYDAAARHEIEPDVAFGLVFVESTFRERAVSHVGARGLAQVMPRTARWLDSTVRTQDLFDPEVNLELGFRYLRMMIDKYDGNLHNALTAYNRGPGTVDRILRRGGNPDNGYAGKVMAG